MSDVRSIKNQERGMVLVVTLLLMSVLALVGTSAVMTSTTDLKITGNYRDSVRSLYDAEAGAHRVIARIQEGTVTLPTAQGGTVTITHTVPSGFNFDSSVTLVNIGNNRFRFSITGRGVMGSQNTIEVVFRRSSALNYGLFADGAVDLKAWSGIYSYDSRILPNPNPANFPAASTGNGDVGSNTSVMARNGTYIGGDIGLGASTAGVNASYTFSGTPIVTGTPGVHVGRVNPDPLGARGGALAARFTQHNASNDNGTITGSSGAFNAGARAINVGNRGTVTLTGRPGGANFFLTSIVLKNGATLNINATAGPVNIYLTGRLEAKNGSSINITGLPTSFNIFSNSTSNIVFKNGSDFRGLVYAPYASVEMKNSANAFGLIWGRTIDIKNSGQFFYDEAVSDNFPSNTVLPVAWRDIRGS